MTPSPHTEFGNEWPGLFPERRDEIDLNIIRIAAKAFKYEEWYYRSKCKGQYVVAAFRKKDFNDSGDEIRFQVFPTNWAIGVCYIHGDEYRNENGTNNSNDTGNEQIENEIEFFRKNKKSTFVHNVSSEVMVIDLLEDPLGNHQYLQQMECPVTNLNIFTRYDNFGDLWKPVVHPSNRSKCGYCGKQPSGDNKFNACSRCKLVSYCDKNCQRRHWKEHKKVCHTSSAFDVSRRWVHVGITSGILTIGFAHDINEIVEINELIECFLFEPGMPPSMNRGRYNCAASCALSDMILELGKTYHDVIGFVDHDVAYETMRQSAQGIESAQDIETITSECFEFFTRCRFQDQFEEEFHEPLNVLRQKLIKLPGDVRSELLHWHFERIQRSSETMIDSRGLPIINQATMIPIHMANLDYSNLIYGEDAERYLCLMFGTYNFADNDSDTNETDETVDTLESDESDISEED